MIFVLRIFSESTDHETALYVIRSGMVSTTWGRRPSRQLQIIELPAGDDKQIIDQDLLSRTTRRMKWKPEHDLSTCNVLGDYFRADRGRIELDEHFLETDLPYGYDSHEN